MKLVMLARSHEFLYPEDGVLCFPVWQNLKEQSYLLLSQSSDIGDSFQKCYINLHKENMSKRIHFFLTIQIHLCIVTTEMLQY